MRQLNGLYCAHKMPPQCSPQNQDRQTIVIFVSANNFISKERFCRHFMSDKDGGCEPNTHPLSATDTKEKNVIVIVFVFGRHNSITIFINKDNCFFSIIVKEYNIIIVLKTVAIKTIIY
jgi:hypothetical protein